MTAAALAAWLLIGIALAPVVGRRLAVVSREYEPVCPCAEYREVSR